MRKPYTDFERYTSTTEGVLEYYLCKLSSRLVKSTKMSAIVSGKFSLRFNIT